MTDDRRRRLRLTVYTDAYELGGAEQSLRNLLANLGGHTDVSVLGVNADVAHWIAAARPETVVKVVRPVLGKLDLGPIVDHVRAIRELRPDVFHANLRTTFACRYGILAALLAPGVRVIAVEQLATPDASRFNDSTSGSPRGASPPMWPSASGQRVSPRRSSGCLWVA